MPSDPPIISSLPDDPRERRDELLWLDRERANAPNGWISSLLLNKELEEIASAAVEPELDIQIVVDESGTEWQQITGGWRISPWDAAKANHENATYRLLVAEETHGSFSQSEGPTFAESAFEHFSRLCKARNIDPNKMLDVVVQGRGGRRKAEDKPTLLAFGQIVDKLSPPFTLVRISSDLGVSIATLKRLRAAAR